MTLYELLFILLFLASVFTLLISVFLRRGGTFKKILLTLAAVWIVYLLVLTATDVLASQKVTKIGEDRCFDEMCFAVAGLETAPPLTLSNLSVTPADKLYVVTVRVTSHSRGRTQAEGGMRARLYRNGRFFDLSVPLQEAYEAQYGKTPKLTQRLAPGESILSVLVFDVPRDIPTPALALDHGFTPGYFVIGESPFLHKPDIFLLPQDR